MTGGLYPVGRLPVATTITKRVGVGQVVLAPVALEWVARQVAAVAVVPETGRRRFYLHRRRVLRRGGGFSVSKRAIRCASCLTCAALPAWVCGL